MEAGKNYAPVISASNGLWRYKIGDTVRFTSVYPHKILITGRTRSFINAFGEELMVDNAERAIHQACLATGSLVREYTVGPVYISLSGKGRHQWLIEFAIPPDSLPDFAQKLDLALQELNSDYAAKRYRDLTLDLPEITIARPNLFYDWLESKGRLGGQHKVPRLSNNRDVLDSLLLAF